MNEDSYDRPRRREHRVSTETEASNSGVKVVVIVLGIMGVVGFCAVSAVVGFFALIVYEAKSAVRRIQAQAQTNMAIAAAQADRSENFRRIAVAIQEYENVHGSLPPLAMNTKSGRMGLSWRVAILPYLNEDALYRRFKIEEPWNQPDNLAAAKFMPEVYGTTNSMSDRTHVRVFSGPGTLFDSTRSAPYKLNAIRDGLANTILLVESADSVLWIEPKELTYELKGTRPQLGQPNADSFWVALADASSRSVKKSIKPEKLRAAITPVGGEITSLDN